MVIDCPLDSHKKIKEISTFILDAKGGSGVVRVDEKVLNLNFLKILESSK